jgi:hypothetical protein
VRVRGAARAPAGARPEAWLASGAALALGLLLILGPGAARARAAGAPPDTALGRYLGTLSDSTDKYFGRAATPLDTAGLDSAEIHPGATPHRARRLRDALSWVPIFNFNRADGSTFGGGVRVGSSYGIGRLELDAAYTVAAQDWLGGATYRRRRERHGSRWTFEAWGGRETAHMNREYDEPFLDAARALVNGTDRTSTLRHDGWSGSLERENRTWHAGLAIRDVLESAAETRATWNLLNRDLVITENLPATTARVRELGLGAGTRLAGLPLWVQGDYWTAGPALSSALAYDRVRVAAGGDLSIGRVASVVPQAAWGFVNGDQAPQDAFYLGAGPTLVSVPRDAQGGSSFGIAKLAVVSPADLLQALHLPHPVMLVLQPGVFAATAAVGGTDPYGGPGRAGDQWPDRANWLSEAGISLDYAPGFGRNWIVRMSEAWPLGPTDRRERFQLVFSRHLDLLRPLYED